MKNINSSYIAKQIFSILNDKIQLKLIIYNKQLQKNFGINITNYKIFSGKYKIIDKNGKGKEFNIFNDELIFEGEYKNKKKNGKGKEYDDKGNLLFEGEYLNGKRNGIGIEYHQNGNMKFHGEYKEGKFWNGKVYNYSETLISEFKNGKGFIEEYNKYGELSFSCEYLNGEKNGIGIAYFYSNNFSYGFSLEYLNGKKWNGKRRLNIAETKRIRFNNFTGQFVYELNEGKGYISLYDYKGKLLWKENYLNGEKNGKIIQMSEFNDIEFEGEYLNNKLNGKVKEYFDYDQIKFEGEYLYGHKRKIKEYFDNGQIKFEGYYLFDREWDGIRYDKEGNIIYKLSQGKGKIVEYANLPSLGKILTFKGEFLNGRRNGKAKEYDDDGKLLFEGEYSNGKRNGIGKEYNYKYNFYSCKYDTNIFEGNYRNGKRNGKGKEYNDDHQILFEGEYYNDHQWNGKGIEKYGMTIIFEGEYLNGKWWNGKGDGYEIKNGKGYVKEHSKYGNLIFEGEYEKGLRNGKGKEITILENSLFEGEYLNGKRWKGKIKEFDDDRNLLFEGNLMNGKKNGKGKEYDYKRLKFEGEYLNGKRNGIGKEYNYAGKVNFEGEYLEGSKHGKGKEYYNSGKIFFEGNYLFGERYGFGKEYYENGKLLFEGEFKGNKQWTGKGYDPEENKIAYEIKDGNGYMKRYDSYSGKIYEEGNYLNGEIEGIIEEYEDIVIKKEEERQEDQVPIPNSQPKKNTQIFPQQDINNIIPIEKLPVKEPPNINLKKQVKQKDEIQEVEEIKPELKNEEPDKIKFTHQMNNYCSPESIKEIETCPPEKLFLVISKRFNKIGTKLVEILKNHERYTLICLYYKIYSNFIQNSNLGINPKMIFQQKDPKSLMKISDFDFQEALVNILNCQISTDELYLILRSLKQKIGNLYSYDEFFKNVYNILASEGELKNIYKECSFYFDDYIYSFRHFIQDNKKDYKSAYSRACTGITMFTYDLFKKFLSEIGFKLGEEKEYIHLFCSLCEMNYSPAWNHITLQASITLNLNPKALLSQKTLFEVADRKDISEEDFCKQGQVLNKKKGNEWTKNIMNFTEETKKLHKRRYESFKNVFQKIHEKCLEYGISDLTKFFEESDFDIASDGDIEFKDFIDAMMNIGVSFNVQLDTLIYRFKNEKKSQRYMIKLVEFLSIYNLFKDEDEEKESGKDSNIDKDKDKESDNKQYIYENVHRKFTQDDIDYINEICEGLAEIIIDELHDSVTNFFNKKDKNKQGYITFDDFKDILYHDLKIDYKSDIEDFQVFFDFILSDKMVKGEDIIVIKRLIYIIISHSKRDKLDYFENDEEEDNNKLKNIDIVDLDIPCNALLTRPALAKFNSDK